MGSKYCTTRNEHYNNYNCNKLNGKTSFAIYYLDRIPLYDENNADWPTDIFDSKPVALTSGGTPVPVVAHDVQILNADYFTFKVLKSGYYRYSSGEDYSEWDYIPTITSDTTINMTKLTTDAYYICYIESIPEEYDHDRKFSGNYKDDTTNDLPDWLDVEYETGTDIENQQIKYLATKPGYYRWDNNTVWKYLDGEVDPDTGLFENPIELLTTGYKDNTDIYYMEELPEYEDSDYEFDDLIKIEPVTDNSGNPVEVQFKILVAGYYKANNLANWTYYNEGDLLVSSTIFETNQIYHLEELDDTLDDLELTIIPRWWML